MTSYSTVITTSKNKNENTSSLTDLKLDRGVIHRISVHFPKGCNGLVNVRIYVGGHPIAPSREGQTFAGDNETISYDEFIDLEKEVNEVVIETWNEDECYDHDIFIRIFILPRNILLPEEILIENISVNTEVMFTLVEEIRLLRELLAEEALEE